MVKVTSVQLALTDVRRSSKVFPDSVMGLYVSLTEPLRQAESEYQRDYILCAVGDILTQHGTRGLVGGPVGRGPFGGALGELAWAEVSTSATSGSCTFSPRKPRASTPDSHVPRGF